MGRDRKGKVNKTMNEYLEQAYECAIKSVAGEGINAMASYALTYPEKGLTDRVQHIKEDYERMIDYWADGYADPERENMYGELMRQLYAAVADAMVRELGKRTDRAYTMADFETFVTDIAMLEFEPEDVRKAKEKNIYKSRQLMMATVFRALWLSDQWTEGIAEEYLKILLSPTVDVNDRCLMVSAITLNIMFVMDVRKLRVLMNVYRDSDEEMVRQRALVGWVISIANEDLKGNDKPRAFELFTEVGTWIDEMMRDEAVTDDVASTQIQILYCTDTKKDVETLQNDIIPDIMKHNRLKIDIDGIKEEDEDPMEDILDTSKSEESMARAEESFHRMLEMQKAGADIYFGGFSQMKRFPFFNDIANWFLPYFKEQPDVAEALKNVKNHSMMENIIKGSAFCNSDKYSFSLAFSNVLDHMPESVRKVLENGEVPDMSELLDDGTVDEGTRIRREYLHDLYRFYNLYPGRKNFNNPFRLFAADSTLLGRMLKDKMGEIATFLARRKRYEEAYSIYSHKGTTLPKGTAPLACYARTNLHMGSYAEALEAYEKLLLINPDKKSYRLGQAICLTHMKEYAKGESELHRLDYEYPNETRILRPLAYCMLCNGKYDQAASVYERILNDDNEGGALLWLGYCLWFVGKYREAARRFKEFLDINGDDDTVADVMEWGVALIEKRGLSDVEVQMMEGLIEMV